MFNASLIHSWQLTILFLSIEELLRVLDKRTSSIVEENITSASSFEQPPPHTNRIQKFFGACYECSNTWGSIFFVRNASIVTTDDDKIPKYCNQKEFLNIGLQVNFHAGGRKGATLHMNVESLLMAPLSVVPHGIGENLLAIKQNLDAAMLSQHVNSEIDLKGIICGADRGYSQVQFIFDSVKKGAEGFIGTHQRGPSMPFRFGNARGASRSVHKINFIY